MRALCFGSLNIDKVYAVPHMVQPGETIASESLRVNCGGKGLNQSIALARAGVSVFHAGKIGSDGRILREALEMAGVDTTLLLTDDSIHSGQAIIQVDPRGENCILLFAGANAAITEVEAAAALVGFGAGDLILLQNEISSLDAIIRLSSKAGMTIVLNPSPMNGRLLDNPALQYVDWFILNEFEGAGFTGQTEPDRILDGLLERFPGSRMVLTLGQDGAIYADAGQRIRQAAYPVKAVDTTAAGDTFTGFFFAGILRGLLPEESLHLAARAASITVARHGASVSIPTLSEVEAALSGSGLSFDQS